MFCVRIWSLNAGGLGTRQASTVHNKSVKCVYDNLDSSTIVGFETVNCVWATV